MRRRFLTFSLCLLLVSPALPVVAAQTPEATPGASPVATRADRHVAGIRPLDIGADGLALSPDGNWLAGVGPEGTPCFWDIATLTPDCAEEQLPVLVHTYFSSIVWAPDSSAVAFALDAIMRLHDSDIYLFERESGALTNLTDDGYEGGLLDGDVPDEFLIDIVPTWSPDGQQILFSRTLRNDEASSTVIMRIDRAGGEPVEVYTLASPEPFTVWMPMYWLPDDTIVYSHAAADPDAPDNGVWRVGIDGSDPGKLIPGTAADEIPMPQVADLDAVGGTMSVYSPLLLGPYSTEWSQPIFWLGDLDGPHMPLPYYDADQGIAVEPASVTPAEMFESQKLVPSGPAALSPDGASAFAVYRTMRGESSLAMMDVATGELAMLESLPPDVQVQPVVPQWADNDTILVTGVDGPLLVTMEREAGARVSGTAVAQTPAATPPELGGAWRVTETRKIPLDTRYAALSPDGRMLAGVGPDDSLCIWDVETLSPECAGERLPIRTETIAWSPDGTAVAFALDTIRMLFESDIYVYELESGELANLTDDGVEGDLLDAMDSDPPADDVPVWSPDSRQLIFARSYRGDEEPGSTVIMRIDRAGGEPVEVMELDVEQPFAVWMPMYWLPDGMLVYSQMSNDMSDPRNGVWKVGVDDGSSPLQVAPGAEGTDFPGPVISDVGDGKAIVYSYYLMAQFAFEGDQPLFWMVDLATGEAEPLPTPPGAGGDSPWVIDAAFSPDGGTALLVTMSSGGSQLMALDVTTGEITPVEPGPRDVRYLPGAPQWATNDTVLLQRSEGPLLVTLEPAT